MIKFQCIPISLVLCLIAGSAFAGDLGLSLDDLITKLKVSADSDGTSLSIKELSCGENPMPGDDTKKIMSCSHALGPGKMMITNAALDGVLLDINTQRWSEADGAKVVSWIAGALNGDGPAGHMDAATKLIADAKANSVGSGTLGKGEFSVLSMSDKFIISVSAP